MGGAAGLVSGGSGGGISTSSSPSSGAQGGTSRGQSGSGDKIFNIGGNPNARVATQSIANTLSNPFVLVAGVLSIWLITRRKRK